MIGKQPLYFLQKALQNIRHFFLIHLITMVIISLSLLVFSIFLMVFFNLQAFIEQWKSQVLVTAYVTESITPDELKAANQRITAFPEVKGVSYVSKEEALALFKKTFPHQENIFQALPENPLPASFEITLKERNRGLPELRTFAEKVKFLPGVEQVEYGGFLIERYLTVLNLIRSTTLAVGGVILLATIFIISNTLRLTVYARKDEIEIMRLAGATNSFIRIPFFIEGIILGLGGALVALVTLYLGYRLLINWGSQFAYLPLQGVTFAYLPLSYLGMVTLGGVMMGLVGSSFSLSRYLKI